MLKNTLCVILIITVCFSVIYSADICTNLIWKKIEYSAKLVTGGINTTTVGSARECTDICRYEPKCKSFAIDSSTMECHLFSGRMWAGQDGNVQSNLAYYWALEPGCPISNGYKLSTDGTVCTKYYSTIANWSNAMKQCETDGGYLLMIDTAAKTAVMTEIAARANIPKYIQIGATDEFEEDVWNWLNGVPVTGSEFIPGRPDNFQGRQHCLAYSTDGLNDLDCSNALTFACEIPFAHL